MDFESLELLNPGILCSFLGKSIVLQQAAYNNNFLCCSSGSLMIPVQYSPSFKPVCDIMSIFPQILLPCSFSYMLLTDGGLNCLCPVRAILQACKHFYYHKNN